MTVLTAVPRRHVLTLRAHGGSRRPRTTPQKLLAASALVASAAVLAGACGGWAFIARAEAATRARAETTQQVRVQTVRTRLAVADATAAEQVLQGTSPSPDTVRHVRYAVQAATLTMVTAARVDADAATLATANRYLEEYVEEVEAALAAAAQGRDADATETLTTASALLGAQVMPRLESVQHASERRASDGRPLTDLGPGLAVALTVAAALTLAGVHAWVSWRTHRMLNPGLAAGAVLLVVTAVAGGVGAASSLSHAAEVRAGPAAAADALVEARTAVFEARTVESLALLAGETATDTWQEHMDAARAAVATARTAAATGAGDATGTGVTVAAVDQVAADLDAYTEVHVRLTAELGAGETAKARRTALSSAVDGAVGAFEVIDTDSGALLARQVRAADQGWADAGAGLAVTGWLTLLVGAVAALCGWQGLVARRREYA